MAAKRAHTLSHTLTDINLYMRNAHPSFRPISWNSVSSICWTTWSSALRWHFYETKCYVWSWKRRKNFNLNINSIAILLGARSTFFSDSMIRNTHSTYVRCSISILFLSFDVWSFGGFIGGGVLSCLFFSFLFGEKLKYFCLLKVFAEIYYLLRMNEHITFSIHKYAKHNVFFLQLLFSISIVEWCLYSWFGVCRPISFSLPVWQPFGANVRNTANASRTHTRIFASSISHR